MAEFTNGQRVRYTGTLVRRLIGQEGAFQEYGRHGWALVDFDRDGLVPCAPENLEAVEAVEKPAPARFVSYRVKPVIETWPDGADPVEGCGTCQAFPDEREWCLARAEVEAMNIHHKAFWSIYGVDQDGFEHVVGDFDTKEAATEIKNAIYPKKPILAKIDVQAADAAADFLDNEAANNTNAAPWAIERAKAFSEVADALRALTNDTDAIVTTDYNDL